MKQSSDLSFRQFKRSDYSTFCGAEAFCPDTIGAAPLISEQDEAVYIIDRRGYTAFLTTTCPTQDKSSGEMEEWYCTFFAMIEEPLAYWPTTSKEAENMGWSKR